MKPVVPDAPEERLDVPPPLLGAWRNLYAVVLCNLALMVFLFWLLTWTYS